MSKILWCCAHLLYIGKHNTMVCLIWLKILTNLFPPYIMGDKGYPLISWIMTPFKEEGHLFVLELLHNKKHKRGHLVMENVFNIPKKTFHELLAKFYFSVSFLLNVFTCCHLLHNLLIFHCFKNPIWTPYYIKLNIVLECLQTYNLSFFWMCR
jgi:hypothetical protein